MAGEIEEPFTLDFRVDSFSSGSISFGRFESEALCWERRSSFLHNRYLEEVEKCSKPGSVTEKKAYFEAHFRKKRFPVLTSPECSDEKDDKFNEKEISVIMCVNEEIDHTNASIHSAQFDQSLDGSESSDHGLDNNKLTECETRADKADGGELGATLAINFESGIQMKENLDCEIAYFRDDPVNDGVSTVIPENQQSSLAKENSTSKPEHIKPRLGPRVSPGPTSKGSINKAKDKVRDDRIRSKAEKKTSGDPNKHCRVLHKTTKYEGGPETKGVDKINSGNREVRSRIRTITEPQFSTSQKASSRPYQSANRVKSAVGVTKPGMRHDISKSTRKEAVPSKIDARKQHAGSSIPGTRLSKISQTVIDQTSSTNVGTNSRASSSAQTSKVKASQAGISLSIGRKKEPEKEKLTRLPERKQKTRIERSNYAPFSTSSSRAGRVAVGVVS